jgi:hypothetical protein
VNTKYRENIYPFLLDDLAPTMCPNLQCRYLAKKQILPTLLLKEKDNKIFYARTDFGNFF